MVRFAWRWVAVAFLAPLVGAGCADPPPPVDATRAELERARWVVWQRDRTIAALEAQRSALSEELRARDAAGTAQASAERAELLRRLDDLARSNADLASAVAQLRQDADRRAVARGPTLVAPIDASADELRHLREQLIQAGFGGVTLNAAQVRALLRTLRPTRPIDEHSPFAL